MVALRFLLEVCGCSRARFWAELGRGGVREGKGNF
jgi:hypothetical protein